MESIPAHNLVGMPTVMIEGYLLVECFWWECHPTVRLLRGLSTVQNIVSGPGSVDELILHAGYIFLLQQEIWHWAGDSEPIWTHTRMAISRTGITAESSALFIPVLNFGLKNNAPLRMCSVSHFGLGSPPLMMHLFVRPFRSIRTSISSNTTPQGTSLWQVPRLDPFLT